MVIHVLSIPSNMTYGFEGVTEEEFGLYNERIDEVLNLTSLGYDDEVMKNTDCSSYLWSDADGWGWSYGASGFAFNADEEHDSVEDISDWFYSTVICEYDFWQEMDSETVLKIAEKIEAYLNA